MGFFSKVFVAALVTVTQASPYGGYGAHCTTTLDTVFQYHKNFTWIENLVVRPNGHILVTRIDKPELHSIDPEAHTDTFVHRFDYPISGLLGIAELKKDVYAVVGVNQTAAFAGKQLPAFIFTADLSKTPAVFKRVATIKEQLFLNGLAAFSEDVVLVTDSGNGVIYRVDLKTGEHTIAASGDLLKPPVAFPAGLGANGLKLLGRYAYFTSSTKGVFGRVPLSKDGYASGPLQKIAATDNFLDDFVITDKAVAYAATNANDTVLRFGPDGSVDLVAGKNNTLPLAGDTSLTWIPGTKQTEAYIGTAGGQFVPINGVTIEPAKVVKIKFGPGCYH